jgi:asparagine synthase (glutamine-hydrolysing)
MSGIAGIICFEGASVEPGKIERLTASMASLGPDEQTHWEQGPVALGHCMLRTTPESAVEHQPLVSQDKSLVMVWDGRLDNRADLRRELIAAGSVVRDQSDAELALQSYATWDESAPRHLLGDFVFVVWDARRHCLFCARDHMGARPLYYTSNDRFFAFASQDEALTPLLNGKPSPNQELIAYSLVPEFLGFDPARSWIEDIWALSAASSISVSVKNEVNRKTYWTLQAGEENKFTSEQECQEVFLETFGEAVRCRMRASGNIAAMMSGGLDSASISAMVNRLLPEMPGKEFHTYSAISDTPESCPETQSILSLTEGMGNRAHLVSVPSFTGILDVQDLLDVAWSKAHPVDNSILLPAMMFLAASRDGQRVMLHGMGGDLTTFVPHRYIAFLLKAGKWREAWKACRAVNQNNTYLQGTSPFRLLSGNIRAAYVPEYISHMARGLRSLLARPPLADSLINPDFAGELNLSERIRKAQERSVFPMPGLQDWHIRILSPPHGISSGLSGYNRVAGRYGLELRDPWSDRRVIEFFLRLPLEYKIPNGWTKHLVRTTFTADLAPEVRWRLSKEHLGWNFATRLMRESDELLAQTLEQHLSVLERFVDVKAVNALFAEYGTRDGFMERMNVYDIIVLALWVRRISA